MCRETGEIVTMERNYKVAARCVAGLLLAIALGIALNNAAQAQVAGGTVQGTVTDASGGAVPGAQVAIKNTATNAVTKVTTNGDGVYAAPNLQAGDYRVTVAAPTFATYIANDVDVTVGAQLQVNVTFKTGSVADRVEVFAGERQVEQIGRAHV